MAFPGRCVVGRFPPLAVNGPASRVTDLFCNTEPSLKGCQDIVRIIRWYPDTLYSAKLRWFFIPVGPHLLLFHQLRTLVLLGVFQQQRGPAASAAHVCFWMDPAGSAASQTEVQKAKGTLPQIPMYFPSTVLVVETIKTKPCQLQHKGLSRMLMPEQILSIGKTLLTSQAARPVSEGSQAPHAEVSVFSLQPCNSFGEES